MPTLELTKVQTEALRHALETEIEMRKDMIEDPEEILAKDDSVKRTLAHFAHKQLTACQEILDKLSNA
jgi:hypothetical protein